MLFRLSHLKNSTINTHNKALLERWTTLCTKPRAQHLIPSRRPINTVWFTSSPFLYMPQNFQKQASSPEVNLPHGQYAKLNGLFGKLVPVYRHISKFTASVLSWDGPTYLPVLVYSASSSSFHVQAFHLTSELPQWLVCYPSPSESN